jgi:putative ABC transport system permease protein
VTTPEQLANGGAETGRPASVIGASPEFAATTGLALLRGRWFTADDTAGAPRVAVVSEWLARAIFQETAVVGRHIVMRNRPATGSTPAPDDEMTIVGVAPDPSPYLLGMPAQAMLYVPFAQRTARDVLISVRAATPARAATALRSAIRRTDPEIAIGASGPAAQVLAGPLQTLRLISAMATALGTLALVLAMAGLHGVLSHVVARRTRELGIRVAIGASRRQVGQLILRDGSRPVLKGLVLGLMIGIGVRIAIAARIHTSASAIDPWLLAVLPLPFAAAALIACALPVLRATRVDPNIALRDL